MRTLLLALAWAPLCASYSLNAPASTLSALRPGFAHSTARLAHARMQEPDEEAAAPPPAPKYVTMEQASSPLAGLVGDMKLEEFQKKKEEDNAKRKAIRDRNNKLIPAAFGLFLAYCFAVGGDTVKQQSQDVFKDPLANAPGMSEARERKAAKKAEADAEKEAMMNKMRTAIRGEEAVKLAEELQAN
jgi:hypothetical protein